jgi:hypothetical protein
MSRNGNPWDNAAGESFMKTLKYEEVHRKNTGIWLRRGPRLARFWRKSTTRNAFTPPSATCLRWKKNYFAGKFRSPHLYQLACVPEKPRRERRGDSAYPTAGVAVDQTYTVQNHRMRVVTLDLNRLWTEIAQSR